MTPASMRSYGKHTIASAPAARETRSPLGMGGMPPYASTSYLLRRSSTAKPCILPVTSTLSLLFPILALPARPAPRAGAAASHL